MYSITELKTAFLKYLEENPFNQAPTALFETR